MATEKSNPKDSTPGVPARRPAANPVSSTAARAHLECTAGPEKGQTFRCAPAVTLIGRDAACEVVLAETVVSRQHTRIERRGETWVLKNLSANGTLVNKKSVDEVVLNDGDDIRLGAKTRLTFVIEAVASLTSGRPQFRARATAREEDEEGGPAGEAAKEGEAETAEKPSLFKRRKNLFIGLAVYLVALLIFAAYLAFRESTTTTFSEIPDLAEDDQIYPPVQNPKPMRIIGEDPDGTVWYEDEFRERKSVSAKDLTDGKARRVAGIRKALDVKFMVKRDAPPGYPYTVEKRDVEVGDRRVKEALRLYYESELPNKESSLFGAVRRFQEALGYYGTGYIPGKSTEEKMRQQALETLIKKIGNTYREAISRERAGDNKQALKLYQLVLKMMGPERENHVWQNVSARIASMRSRYPDLP